MTNNVDFDMLVNNRNKKLSLKFWNKTMKIISTILQKRKWFWSELFNIINHDTATWIFDKTSFTLYCSHSDKYFSSVHKFFWLVDATSTAITKTNTKFISSLSIDLIDWFFFSLTARFYSWKYCIKDFFDNENYVSKNADSIKFWDAVIYLISTK